MTQKLIIQTTVNTAEETAAGATTNSTQFIAGTDSRTADSMFRVTPTLAAGIAGAISATGVDGLETGHGIEAADLVGVSWLAATRYHITVDTATANAIVFDDTPTAGGDALPAEETAVIVSVETSLDIAGDGDQVQAFAVSCDQAANVRWLESDGTVIWEIELTAGVPYAWVESGPVANPLTGNPWSEIVAVNRTTTAANLELSILYDA